MMKFIFLIMMSSLMVFFNKKNMFYYNIIFFMSFMFMFKFMFKDNLWISLSYMIGCDFYSFFLLMLSVWVMGLVVLTVQSDGEKENYKEKLLVFLIMFMILLMFFSSMNLIMFYFMFELSLVPTFIMIIYWGLNYERLSASYYLFMYTMFISLPLFIYILKLYKFSNSMDFSILSMNLLSNYYMGFWDYMIMFLAFYIKMPMYLFHIWLPKAHVEAPVYGSMILAAILLKLGSYGLIRFMEMFVMSSMKFNYIIYSIGIVGSILVSLICLVQIDMKSLVAYSSVVHMNLLMCSMLTLMKIGFISAFMMMISHGLCSSGLFYMVNLYYERSHSRVVFFNKGMINLFPSLSLWWFILCAANFSFPFSLNFLSEIFMISVIISWDIIMMIYLMVICFFSSAYSLYLYSYIQHGSLYVEMKMYLVSLKDLIVLVIHTYPLMFILMNLTMLF